MQIETIDDLTGNGIKDIVLTAENKGWRGETKYLFVGQEDGSYVQAKGIIEGKNDIKYFRTRDRTIYFFDGELYRKGIKP